MIDLKQFRELIIRPTLSRLNLWCKASENLVLGTALVESGLIYLKQLGDGPAVGFFQMEPATHNDLLKNYLDSRPIYMQVLRDIAGGAPGLLANNMICNLNYATAMCRLDYHRAPAPLPAADDAEGMAEYHKQYYNTSLGATDTSKSVALFQQAIAA